MENENASVVKIRLEGLTHDVTQAANTLKSILRVVDESHNIPMRRRDVVQRYLIALVKHDK
jgi:hypothetical protein